MKTLERSAKVNNNNTRSNLHSAPCCISFLVFDNAKYVNSFCFLFLLFFYLDKNAFFFSYTTKQLLRSKEDSLSFVQLQFFFLVKQGIQFGKIDHSAPGILRSKILKKNMIVRFFHARVKTEFFSSEIQNSRRQLCVVLISVKNLSTQSYLGSKIFNIFV